MELSGDGAHLYAATDGAGVVRLDLYGVAPQSGTPLESTDAPFLHEGDHPEEIAPEGEESQPDEKSPEIESPAEEDVMDENGKFKLPCLGGSLPLLIVGLIWFEKRRR